MGGGSTTLATPRTIVRRIPVFDDISILRGLAQLPAVPFREEHIAAYIAREARAMGLEPQQDACGNLLVHYRRGEVAVAQPLAFVAHMDHPGLEVIAVDGQQAQARLLGGVAPGYFEGQVPVQVHGSNGVTSGRVTAARTGEDQSTLVLDLALDGPAAAGDYAVWDMPAFSEDGDLLRMRAADDLAGCGAALSTLRELVRQNLPGDVYGIFTRAEEVGLIGATLVAQAGLLPANTVVVSLESSRTLPGAVAGEGPVIRVGDYRTTFHPEAEAL